jgi:hypothetical protein
MYEATDRGCAAKGRDEANNNIIVVAAKVRIIVSPERQ